MNINLVQVCGRLTKTPESRTTQGGLIVLSFSVATNRSWKDKQGQKQEETEFHNVTAFGRTAEVITEYFKKGDEIYIIGRLKTSSWEDKKTGQKRYKTDIIAERFEFGQKSRANQGEQTEPQKTVAPVTNDEIPVVDEDEEVDVSKIPF